MPKKILTAAIISLLALVFFSGPAALPEPEKPLPQITWQQIVLDPPPLPAGEHILVAAEDFLSLGGGSAGWYRDKGVLRGSKVATVTPGDRMALIDGTPRLLDTAPVMTGDRLYIPLGLALEVLGMSGGGRVPYPSPGQNPGWEGDPAGSGRPVYLPAPQSYRGARFRYYPVYDLQARYDPTDGRIQGELLLAYQNPYLMPLRQLYFNLPANAPYGHGAKLTVTRVLINNQSVPFNTRGSTLEIFLPRSLAPRETLSLALSFTTCIPEGAKRLGRNGDSLVAAGWYPILAPYNGANPAGVAATTYGDPYFADAAYYRVSLTLPPGYRVLASSRQTGRQEAKEGITWTFQSEHPIREFAFTAAPDLEFTSRQAGPVWLTVASRGEPAAALAVAEEALDFFQEFYGPYPYSYLNLAFVPLDDLAGMEYPGFVLLSTTKKFNPAVVVHEVAHQWWYNLVGNDSKQAAWIDEGLAEYSTLIFYRQRDPALYLTRLAEIGRLAGQTPQPVNLPLEEYGSEQAYRQAVYNRGASFWLEVEAAVGKERLRQALAYVQRYYRYEIIPPRSLLAILTYYGRLTAANFTPFFRN